VYLVLRYSDTKFGYYYIIIFVNFVVGVATNAFEIGNMSDALKYKLIICFKFVSITPQSL